jgi:hypothetical protein
MRFLLLLLPLLLSGCYYGYGYPYYGYGYPYYGYGYPQPYPYPPASGYYGSPASPPAYQQGTYAEQPGDPNNCGTPDEPKACR